MPRLGAPSVPLARASGGARSRLQTPCVPPRGGGSSGFGREATRGEGVGGGRVDRVLPVIWWRDPRLRGVAIGGTNPASACQCAATSASTMHSHSRSASLPHTHVHTVGSSDRDPPHESLMQNRSPRQKSLQHWKDRGLQPASRRFRTAVRLCSTQPVGAEPRPLINSCDEQAQNTVLEVAL